MVCISLHRFVVVKASRMINDTAALVVHSVLIQTIPLGNNNFHMDEPLVLELTN